MNRSHFLAIAILSLGLPSAFAAAPGAGSPAPSTPVVWVASLHGAVSFQPSGFQGDEGWVPAEVNHPLVAGDRISTVGQAGVELRGNSGSVTIPADTTILLQRLDQDAVLLKLEQGGLDLKIDRYSPAPKLEVATPNLSLEPVAAGQYRFDTDQSGNVRTVSVQDGQCLASWDSGRTFTVGAGQQAQVSGNSVALDPPSPLVAQTPAPGAPNPPQYPSQDPPNAGDANLSPQPQPNDAYTGATPNADPNANADPQGLLAGYDPDTDPGADQLASYGAWSPGPSGGQVWYPTVAVGWAPYTDGHWQWIDPWGWTWIDRAPWGFAPFHYGRWASSPRGWYWVPGPPVYSPALVAWVGTPGIGRVAWIPLGPGETVGYGAIGARYVNHSYVTVVASQTFIGAAPVYGARLPATPGLINRSYVGSYAAVKPERASVLGSSRIAPHPPLNVMARPGVTRIQPGQPVASFSQRQALWAQTPGRPLTSAQTQQAGFRPAGFRVAAPTAFQSGYSASQFRAASPYRAAAQPRPTYTYGQPGRPQPQPAYRGQPTAPQSRPGAQYARPQPARPQPQQRQPPKPRTAPSRPAPAARPAPPPAAHHH